MGSWIETLPKEHRARAPRGVGTPEALCRWLLRLEPEAGGFCPSEDAGAVDVSARAVEHALKLGYVRGELDGAPLERWHAEGLFTLTALGEAVARWGTARVLDGAPDA